MQTKTRTGIGWVWAVILHSYLRHCAHATVARALVQCGWFDQRNTRVVMEGLTSSQEAHFEAIFALKQVSMMMFSGFLCTSHAPAVLSERTLPRPPGAVQICRGTPIRGEVAASFSRCW